MGKCSNCGKKILYNKYKMYRGKILCPECFDTRLERKAAKKAELRKQAELVKIVTPSKKAKKAMKKKGIKKNTLDDIVTTGDTIKNEEGKTAEDSR